jgi:hypothetical protein
MPGRGGVVAKRLSRIKAKFVVLLAGAMLAIPLFIASATPASAYDNYPCSSPAHHVTATLELVQDCLLWRGNVPVYASPYRIGWPNWVVGYLYSASGNWFICQFDEARGADGTIVHTATYHYGSYYNNWWAWTIADNGRYGYVPEVFFKGGNNNEPDRGLANCLWT